jgi:hypothetical protein
MAAGTEPCAPSLEERVAVLEAAMAAPLKAYIPQWTPPTEAEEAELREQVAEAAKMPPRVIQQPVPLSPDEIRQILRECVTVVKPGETLAVRLPSEWPPQQVRDYSETLRAQERWLDVPFRVLVVVGDEMAVAEAGP